LISAKPRSNLFAYEEGEAFEYEKQNSITTDKIIFEVFSAIIKLLEATKEDHYNIFRNRLFRLLDHFTSTPKEIKEIMEAQAFQIDEIADTIAQLCNVQESPSMDKALKEDINNTVEKYFSINWPDIQIFTKDRDAYPVKLKATDEEDSTVEQTAAEQSPLQTRAIFFDNKKMLYASRACDGMWLKWKSVVSDDENEKYFNVRIAVSTKAKGFCAFKFTEYTSKEDIDRVVFSIISHEGIDGATTENN